MPPASPAPGWSSGLVCTESVATRRGAADRGRRRAATSDLPASAQGAGRHPLDSPSCNNAGGAFDAAPVAEADLDSWERTYEINVLGTVRLTKALLPKLIASGAGDLLFMGSTAGLISYEGGASYTAAKHAVHTLAETLRLELYDQPVRVVEIAPGMVRTEEFTLNRVQDRERAEAVYRGVREPLVAEDVADCIAWTLTRPHHVNVDLLVVRPRAQAAQHKAARDGRRSTTGAGTAPYDSVRGGT